MRVQRHGPLENFEIEHTKWSILRAKSRLYVFFRITQIAKYLNFDGKSYTSNVKRDGDPGGPKAFTLITPRFCLPKDALLKSKAFSLNTSSWHHVNDMASLSKMTNYQNQTIS